MMEYPNTIFNLVYYKHFINRIMKRISFLIISGDNNNI